ncbi:Ubiquitin carboxyl-terminal hydrolase 21, partial [Nowakowskiella sp. JEL0407]
MPTNVESLAKPNIAQRESRRTKKSESPTKSSFSSLSRPKNPTPATELNSGYSSSISNKYSSNDNVNYKAHNRTNSSTNTDSLLSRLKNSNQILIHSRRHSTSPQTINYSDSKLIQTSNSNIPAHTVPKRKNSIGASLVKRLSGKRDSKAEISISTSKTQNENEFDVNSHSVSNTTQTRRHSETDKISETSKHALHPTPPRTSTTNSHRTSLVSVVEAAAAPNEIKISTDPVDSEKLSADVQYLLGVSPFKSGDGLKKYKRFCNDRLALMGLSNLGQTCYMNSILQCLFSCKILAGYFLSDQYRIDSKTNEGGALHKYFAELIEECYNSSRSVAAPRGFFEEFGAFAPEFAGFEQQDSQEYLRLLLDKLHDELNKIKKWPRFVYTDNELERIRDTEKALFWWNNHRAKNQSIISELFCGQMHSTVTCNSCGKSSSTFEIFWDISLPVPAGRAYTPISLEDCLSRFCSPEPLEDLYFCEKCNTKTKAVKCIKFYRFPEILVIQLKRFTSDNRKIESNVMYPVEGLTLGQTHSLLEGGDKDDTYDLVAVSNHIGGVDGGHYIATCRNEDGKWYRKDDD